MLRKTLLFLGAFVLLSCQQKTRYEKGLNETVISVHERAYGDSTEIDKLINDGISGDTLETFEAEVPGYGVSHFAIVADTGATFLFVSDSSAAVTKITSQSGPDGNTGPAYSQLSKTEVKRSITIRENMAQKFGF